LWIRGLHDGSISRDPASGTDTPTPALTGWITNYMTAIQGNSLCIRSLVPLVPNTQASYNIISSVAASAVPGQTVISFVGPGMYPPWRRAVISGLSPKTYPGLSGRWDVISSTVNTITIRYNMPANAPNAPQGGRWRVEAFNYFGIDANISRFDHFGTRATGGASGGTGRGRKRAIHLRSL
jgi:hypothetical protein